MNAQLSSNDLISSNDQMQAGIIIPAQAPCVQLVEVAGKAVELDFDGGLLSSDYATIRSSN